jgi:hypothetical protein
MYRSGSWQLAAKRVSGVSRGVSYYRHDNPKAPRARARPKEYADDMLPGFAVRVPFGGSRTFVLTVGSDRQRITIGRYPIVSLAQAREKARTVLAQRLSAPSRLSGGTVDPSPANRPGPRSNSEENLS